MATPNRGGGDRGRGQTPGRGAGGAPPRGPSNDRGGGGRGAGGAAPRGPSRDRGGGGRGRGGPPGQGQQAQMSSRGGPQPTVYL